jgi:single-strand DNA-binding protein
MPYSEWKIYGNIGRDPELRYTKTGKAVWSVEVGSSHGKDENRKTIWYSGTAWEEIAEKLGGEGFQKGDYVCMIARPVEVRQYTKKDGTTGFSLDCSVISFQRETRKDESQEVPF